MRYAPRRVQPADLLAAISDLGYAPVLVAPAPAGEDAEIREVDVSALPEGLREAFRLAALRDAPVLLDFTAPG